MYIIDIEWRLDRVERAAQRLTPIFVGEFMPVALVSLGGAPVRERAGEPAVPVEDGASGVEGQYFDSSHSSSLK